MYHWYKRLNQNGQIQLTREENMSLAGCNNGIIATELKEILSTTNNAPIGWILPIAEKWNKEEYSAIIDIKPKSSDEVFLCELDKVFGYSYPNWSPIMMRLKILLYEEEEIDKTIFMNDEDPDIIYTMLYLSGGIQNGKLKGTWNFPGPSSTNSLLFWPEAMTFFNEQVKKH